METVNETRFKSGKTLNFLRLNKARRLAKAARTRYKESGKAEDLEQMVAHFSDALSFCPPGQPGRDSALDSLGDALNDRFGQLGSVADLDDAIAHLQEALSLRPPGHPSRSDSLKSLGVVLCHRYRQLGRIVDLEEAITYQKESLNLCPPGHPDRAMSLNNLAIALRDRYNQLGRIVDLEDAITHRRECLSLFPPGHPDRSMYLNDVAIALQNRYNQLGRIVDLEDAISHHCESLSLRPPGHLLRSSALSNLGYALHERYQQLGRIVDLEDAIAHHHESLSLCPPGHPVRPRSLNNLAIALSDRYNQLGRIVDLEDAITHHREAVSLRPPGHPLRSGSLTNLAAALYLQYKQLGMIMDLEDAIAHHRESLSLCPPGHPHRSTSLNNAAIALHDRYNQLGRIMDLEDAITHHRESLSLRPPGHPLRSMTLNNVAIGLHDRYKQLGRIVDLEDAMTHHRESLFLCPIGHPFRSTVLSNLADTLFIRYDLTHDANDIQEFFKLIQQVVDDSAASLNSRLFAAQRWASVARNNRDDSLLDAYSMIFRLLNRSLILHPDIDSQHKFLAGVDISIASDAASAAIDAQDLVKAIELLEQGRAILWSKMTAYRHPLDELRLADEELADQFANISAELEDLALFSESQRLDGDRLKMSATSEGRWRKMRDLSAKWDEVVELIRAKHGFSSFLQAIPFETLREAAADGPIIVINVSKYRSDAIFILLDGPPSLVALPDVWPERLSDLHSQLATARNGRTFANPSTAIYPILQELWTNIVCPIVDRLKELGVAQKSHIWWCPTSELCGLPLHAAGPYRPGQRNLPDLYISSYAPTLSALINSRSNIISQKTAPKMLVIGQPDETLHHVLPEIEHIRQISNDVDVIVGAEANHSAIIDGLQHHSWVHFACHGYLGGDAGAFQASFKLHGGSHLKLVDLIQARLPNAEFAFLSACHSAAADRSTPNEAISLAAALQFCGFRSVVGTLWAMNDDVGPAISKEFYKHMFRNSKEKVDFRDAAEALNLAIRTLRKSGLPLDRWIMFVHIGA